MLPLYLLFLFAAFLFVIVVFSGEPDIGYVFNFTRHEWYRELRRDYHTSVQQFWRDWRLFRRFARQNGPWIWASTCGIVGLIITAILLIVNLPHELKASVRNVYQEHVENNEPTFVTRQGTIDTRTQVIADGQPLAEEESVLVYIPPGDYPPPAAIVRQSEPRFTEPPDPEPRIEVRESFEEFLREPQEPEGDLMVEMDRIPDDQEMIEQTSISIVDVDTQLRGMGPDEWDLVDEQRVRTRPRPILYRERHGDIQLSAHKRELMEIADDQIRLRPRAVGRDISPGLHIVKSAPRSAVAGMEFTYTIKVSNPHDEVVPAVIIEEQIPDGWAVVDATPRGVLVNESLLRWDVTGLSPDEALEFQVRILAGGDTAGRTRTVITTGAAVETLVDVGEEKIIPAIAPEPAPKPDIPANGWAAAGSKIEEPERDLTKLPSLPPSRTQTVDPKIRVLVNHPKRARLGPVQVKFTIRNEGTVAVENTRILVWLDDELTHARGRQINKAVGALKPGDVKTVTLSLTATNTGETSSTVELRSDRTVLDRGWVVMAIGGNEGSSNRSAPSTSAPKSGNPRASEPPVFEPPPTDVEPASFWQKRR